MTRRIAIALGCVAILGGLILIARPATVHGQGALCAFPDKLTYSPGALAAYDGQIYKCVWQFGDDLKPRSLGWIRMSRIPSDFAAEPR